MTVLDLTSAPHELRDLAAIADRRTRAVVNESDATDELRDELVRAAGAAMAAGCSLGDIARAEEHGKSTARSELRGDLLRKVSRSARRLNEAEVEHNRSIMQAVELGLPYRDVAEAAGVSHGTIRAIVTRAQFAEDDLHPATEAAALREAE